MAWRFLERNAELAAFEASIRAIRDGQGRFLAVEGTAGLGKTSLLDQAAATGEEAGFLVLSGRAGELEREYPFGLVKQLFTPVVRTMSAARERDLPAGAVRALSALGLRESGGAVEPVAEFALLHGLYWLVAGLCRERPVMLLADDLHWADVSSLRFLGHMLPRLDGMPALVVATVRPNEPGPYLGVVEQIVTDPSCRSLRLGPLSPAAARRLVRDTVGEAADEEFVEACRAAAGGNPLFLRELTRAVSAEDVAPVAANAGRVRMLGQRAVARRVAIRLAQLPAPVVRLTRAMAILGDGADLALAARLADMPLADAGRAAVLLRGVEILRLAAATGAAERWEFVHPLVRAAVYGSMDPAARTTGHARASRLLAAAGAGAEQVSAHLLHTLPGEEHDAAAVLRRAAADALGRGAPESAAAYLRRCLREPLGEDERLGVLLEAGAAAAGVDVAQAADHLTRALDRVDDVGLRARISTGLGPALWFSARPEEAVAVMTRAAAELPAEESDVRRHLAALVLNIPLCVGGWRHLLGAIPDLRRLPPADTLGARMLDCMIACADAFDADPGGVEPARAALADGRLIREAGGASATLAGCLVLLVGDLDGAMAALDAGLAGAYAHGMTATAAAYHAHRMFGRLTGGDLAAAESDGRAAMRGVEQTGTDAGRPLVAGRLAMTLVEQGRLEEAQAALDWALAPDSVRSGLSAWFLLEGQAWVLRAGGRPAEALEMALAAGERFAASGGRNPALVAWRSEAALCLRAMGRVREARELAAAELDLARRWNAPPALGRALRVAGLVTGGEPGLALLREAVAVLEPSRAALERAKALVDLGAALHRAGESARARDLLRQGAAHAETCGARPLVELAREELRGTGARPRRTAVSGVGALTPTERRVARLAAAGASNRDIAEALFVLPKTVEVHLTSVYRKLGVRGRAHLARSLPELVDG
ncbi:AAA family ATPase [Sphaerisporangium sp. TRM90804]|uniref:ATP-binding protein n=1 Tax=Sphaerisporangium sp. TRM90804 TaxID=3031113 RepID=UPI00244CE68C|nr:AAA family ATPase [Sphaerisporangium sp. TRM90804]MDH2429480.1 AAA family ATPase [Sphaerisporangium sp. TRM90804]